jgi:large subunit ribosomal protein L25
VRTDTVVSAQVRETRGKNEARRMRVSGLIPGVVYGAFKDPISIALNPRQILQILRSKTGHNTIFNLDVAGQEKTPVMVVDEQYEPVKWTLLHVDLKRIDLQKRIRVLVPVLVHGEARGIKLQGGQMEIITRSIEIECLPDDIPQNFVVDVSDLMVGENIRASAIVMPGTAQLTGNPETVIAHVVGHKAEEAPVVEAVVAEPEVAKKGKKDEAAAPAAAAAPEPKAKKK